MHTFDPSSTLLDQFVAGECASHDAERIKAWLAADSTRWDQIDEIIQLRNHLAQEPVWDRSRMWAKVEAEMGVESEHVGEALSQSVFRAVPEDVPEVMPATNAVPHEPVLHRRVESRPQFGRSISRPFIGFVAALVLMIGAVSVFNALPGANGLVSSAVDSHTITTVRGQRVQITLPDGTDVIVGPDTRLTYTDDNSASKRIVTLQGEAVFTVKHAERKPFTVQTRESSVRVLGTTFGVRQYADDSAARVVVTDGKVSVAPTMTNAGTKGTTANKSQDDHDVSLTPVVLSRGNRAIVLPNGKMVIDRDGDVDNAMGWTTGLVEFVMVPLRVVVADLIRFYDIDLRLASVELGNQIITVGISDQQTPSEMIAMIADIVGARVERHGNTFTFYTK